MKNVKKTYEEASLRQTAQNMEVNVKKGDGKLLPMRLTIFPVLDCIGNIDDHIVMLTAN